jgi:hypothetical protein
VTRCPIFEPVDINGGHAGVGALVKANRAKWHARPKQLRSAADYAAVPAATCNRGSAMPTWLGDLSARERRTMIACFGGWMLDGFDGQLYSYVVPRLHLG